MARYSRSDTTMDAASQFFPQSFLAGRMRLSAFGQEPALAPSGTGWDINWGEMIGKLGDIYTTATQAELTRDLYELNLERARAGQAPIAASAVAPQMNVGVAPDVQRTITMVVLGGAAILGGAYVFGGLGKRGKRRRSRR